MIKIIKIARSSKEVSRDELKAGSGMAQAAAEPHERVGYKRPPKQHRWKKGESGNPLGRPRRGNFWADLYRELGRVVTVTEGGKRKRKTVQQLAVRQVMTQAAKGDARFLEILLKAMKHLEEPKQPEFEKGKAYEYLKDRMAKIIIDQRKAGYNERVAEEANGSNLQDFWGTGKSDVPDGQG